MKALPFISPVIGMGTALLKKKKPAAPTDPFAPLGGPPSPLQNPLGVASPLRGGPAGAAGVVSQAPTPSMNNPYGY